MAASIERILRRSSRESRTARSPRRHELPPVGARDAGLALPKPFLKWAGGKRQLLPHIRAFYPARFRGYVEPFLGSGAVFFDLAAEARLLQRRVVLADINPDVVGVFTAVRDALPPLLASLDRLAAEHARMGTACYYDVRDRRFNPLRHDSVIAAGADESDAWTYPADLAAMFIYLNRTGFNGLFRLNSRGVFNVPAGRYANPTICDRATLTAASEVLRRTGAVVRMSPFEDVAARAERGDFVYVDPPYAPVSATSHFTAYTAQGFDAADQRRLRDVVVDLARRGVHVLVSNSTAPLVRDLYDTGAARRAGLRLHTVPARRAINARASSRGPVAEYLISNVIPRV